jgi:hypothetical protein
MLESVFPYVPEVIDAQQHLLAILSHHELAACLLLLFGLDFPRRSRSKVVRVLVRSVRACDLTPHLFQVSSTSPSSKSRSERWTAEDSAR